MFHGSTLQAQRHPMLRNPSSSSSMWLGLAWVDLIDVFNYVLTPRPNLHSSRSCGAFVAWASQRFGPQASAGRPSHLLRAGALAKCGVLAEVTELATDKPKA